MCQKKFPLQYKTPPFSRRKKKVFETDMICHDGMFGTQIWPEIQAAASGVRETGDRQSIFFTDSPILCKYQMDYNPPTDFLRGRRAEQGRMTPHIGKRKMAAFEQPFRLQCGYAWAKGTVLPPWGMRVVSIPSRLPPLHLAARAKASSSVWAT